MLFSVSLDPAANIPLESLPLLLDRLAHLAPVIADMAGIVSAWEKKNFDTEGAAFGDPWPQNSPETQARKTAQGFHGGTLVRTGWLRGHIGDVLELAPTGFTVGVDPAEVPYAPILAKKYVLVAMVDAEVAELTAALAEYLSDVPGLPAGAVRITATP